MNQDTGQGLEDVKLSRPFRPQDAIAFQGPRAVPWVEGHRAVGAEEESIKFSGLRAPGPSLLS